MKYTLAILAAMVLASIEPAAQAAEGKPARVLLTTGGHAFEQKQFFALFDAMKEIAYTKAEMPAAASRLTPALRADFDVLVMYDMNKKISADEAAQFTALAKAGIGIVSLHHNVGANAAWDGFRDIIGGKYIFKETEIDGRKYAKTPWQHGQDMPIHVADAQHPITRGISDFTIHDETYGVYYVSPKAHILLTTTHPKNNPQIAWTYEVGASRVVYLQLGHDSKAYEHPAYGELVRRSILWTIGRLK